MRPPEPRGAKQPRGHETRLAVARAAILLCLAAASCAPLPPVTPPAPPPQAGGAAPPPETPRGLKLEEEPSIEVGVAWDVDSLTLVAFKPMLTWRTGRVSDRAAGRASTLFVSVAGGRGELRAGSVRSEPIATFVSDTLWVGEPDQGAFLAEPQILWKGKTWRGQAKLFVNPRGKLSMALRLPLESYLMGVVPGEIGALSESLLEAGRAQAIAARSYTLYYRGRRGAEGFDVYGTVEDQVYGPAESERPLASRCVTSTRGQVALYDGVPIRANYYSTCGGITADVWEGFPATGFAYLASHRDAEGGQDYCARSPQYRWKEEWGARDFLETVARYARAEGLALPAEGLGTLIDVRVASRSRSGRVWRLEIETSTGVLTVPAYSIRRVLRRPAGNGAILRSNLFKVDVRRDPSTRRSLYVVVSGAGSGHGVGLCQTGALGMAAARKTGEEILAHYYPRATLRQSY